MNQSQADSAQSPRTWLRIGHRGAAAHAPHNTLAGFRKAAELGADMVELDVQRSADGYAVVIHDLFLSTAQGQVLPVKQTTLAELRAVDLGWGERVPTLPQALALCRELGLGVYIEIKDGAAGPLVVEALRGLQHDRTEAHRPPAAPRRSVEGRCLVGSFRPDWVADVRAADPALVTSILFGSRAFDGGRAASLAQACGASYVHPCWESHPQPSALLTPEWLAAVRAAGLKIITWHEERPAEIAALQQLGVDGICSDRPELL